MERTNKMSEVADGSYRQPKAHRVCAILMRRDAAQSDYGDAITYGGLSQSQRVFEESSN
jgi:hypothetical protein